jgi:DNA-binding transcriptional ArsR family regulator
VDDGRPHTDLGDVRADAVEGTARDDLFAVLAGARRRTVLRLVRERSPEGIGTDDLGRRLAAESADRGSDAGADERRAVRVALHHRLLPRLTDAGLLEETADGSLVTADHWVFDDPRFEDLLSRRQRGDPDDLDAAFGALADGRRRLALSVLDTYARPIALEALAREVASREDRRLAESGPRDRVDAVLASLVHVHLPRLDDDGLVDYDADEGRVSAADHPVLRPGRGRPADGSEPETNGTPAETNRPPFPQ